MKIISLKKVVEEQNIQQVSLAQGEGVAPVIFEVGSPDYKAMELWLVKGGWNVTSDEMTRIRTLHIEKIEEALNITVNPVTVETENNDPEAQAKLEEHINTPITIVVFHRTTLDSAGKEVKRKDVTAFAHAVVENYQKSRGEAKLEDFAVVEIDWANRHVAMKSIATIEEEVKS